MEDDELDPKAFAAALAAADVAAGSPLMTCPTPSRRESLASVATEATAATTSTVAGTNQHVRVVVRVKPHLEEHAAACLEWAGDKVCVQPPELPEDAEPPLKAPRTPGRVG
eukprot:1393547-Prymnesium_polylepis.1